MAGKDDNFKVLKKKEIYEFLEGNGPSLVTHNGTEYGLPYYTGTQLSSLCTEFGLTEVVGGSRWCYVEELLDYVIEQQRCDELFRFLFSEKQFTNLQDIQHYIKFFANKDRTQKFYDLEIENFNRSTIEVALMSVLCKDKTASFEEVLRSILTDDGLQDNKYLAEFEKYDLLSAFWQQADVAFGYNAPKPTLEKLVITMFVTYAAKSIHTDMPQAWKPFISYKSGNIIAFMDNLMNSYLYGTRFDEISEIIYNAKDRVVVIISDALRYEVAHTLFEKMQADEKCNASIGAMQGVLPSYTPLGMASLLPHKTIEYSPSYDVLVDGKACSSTEQREAILKEYKISSKCIQFDSMKTMKQADLRSIFTGQDVVYIYHNQIDARGDKAASENEVFTACEEAIEEIYTLIKRIVSCICLNNNSKIEIERRA